MALRWLRLAGAAPAVNGYERITAPIIAECWADAKEVIPFFALKSNPLSRQSQTTAIILFT